jgi:hypothetical protein
MAKLRNPQIGLCDVWIDEPRGGYFGLRLELKRESDNPYKLDGTLKMKKQVIKRRIGGRWLPITVNHLAEQERVIKTLNRKGYFASFAVGYSHAIKLIDVYMSRPYTKPLKTEI